MKYFYLITLISLLPYSSFSQDRKGDLSIELGGGISRMTNTDYFPDLIHIQKMSFSPHFGLNYTVKKELFPVSFGLTFSTFNNNIDYKKDVYDLVYPRHLSIRDQNYQFALPVKYHFYYKDWDLGLGLTTVLYTNRKSKIDYEFTDNYIDPDYGPLYISTNGPSYYSTDKWAFSSLASMHLRKYFYDLNRYKFGIKIYFDYPILNAWSTTLSYSRNAYAHSIPILESNHYHKFNFNPIQFGIAMVLSQK